MKLFSLKRLFVGALLLAVLPASMSSPARGDDWPSWMTGSKNSKEFEAQLSMARLNERHGQHDAAIKIYVAVLSKQPNNQLAHHRLAVIAASNGDFTRADKHFSDALKSGPRSPELLGDVAYSLFLQNRLDESEEALRRTLSEFPTYKKARNTLGMVLGLKGRYEEALHEFRQVVSEDEAHANLAFVLVQAGDLELANKHYHEAIRLNPALRPAAEALVQLNARATGESPTNSATPKSAEPAGNSNIAATASKAPATIATAAKSPITRPQIAKPAATIQKAFTPNQPGSQQATASDVQATAEKAEPVQISENPKQGGQKANPIPEVAQPFAPKSPVVATQSETTFAPAVIGLAQKDRLSPGIKDASIASKETKQKRTMELFPAAAEAAIAAKPNRAPAIAEISTDIQPGSPGATAEASQATIPGQNASIADREIRAQVFNYPIPETAQAMASDDSAAARSEPVEIEITDEDIAKVEVSSSEPAVAFAPSASALQAARAQAALLAELDAKAIAEEPAMVPTSEMQPIPLPVADEFQAAIQAEPIPVNDFITSESASPASFVIASEGASPQPMEIETSEAPAKTTPEIIESIRESINSMLEGNPPAPWQIVVMTLAGTFGLITLGKTARRLGRRQAKVASKAPQASEVIEEIPVEEYEPEETYTYLEGQIRDVCAGLPASHRSAERIRKS